MTAHANARVRAGAVVLAGALLTLTAGCGLMSSNATTVEPTTTIIDVPPHDGGHLVVAVPAESNGWNPIINQWADSGALVGASMIEPLAIQDDTGRPVPWLAESWQPNADFTEWTVTVRPNVYFHD